MPPTALVNFRSPRKPKPAKKALFPIQFSAFSAILEMASILQTLQGILPSYKNQRMDNLVSP